MSWADGNIDSADVVYGERITCPISHVTRGRGADRVKASAFVLDPLCSHRRCTTSEHAVLVPEDETLLCRLSSFSPYIVLRPTSAPSNSRTTELQDDNGYFPCWNIFGFPATWNNRFADRDIFGYALTSDSKVMLRRPVLEDVPDSVYHVDYVHGSGSKKAFSADPGDHTFRLVDVVSARALQYWFRRWQRNAQKTRRKVTDLAEITASSKDAAPVKATDTKTTPAKRGIHVLTEASPSQKRNKEA